MVWGEPSRASFTRTMPSDSARADVAKDPKHDNSASAAISMRVQAFAMYRNFVVRMMASFVFGRRAGWIRETHIQPTC